MNKIIKVVTYPILVLVFLSVFSILKHTDELSASELADIKSALEIEERLVDQYHERDSDVELADMIDLDEFQAIKMEDSGEHVMQLQELLNLEADGVFGEATHEKVKEIQEKHKLVVDGVVGYETMEIIKEMNREITFVN